MQHKVVLLVVLTYSPQVRDYLVSCNSALGKNTTFQMGDIPSALFSCWCVIFHKCVLCVTVEYSNFKFN